MRARFFITAAALLVVLTLQTMGCSGPREDVRVTLCKRLTTNLLDVTGELQWQETRSQFQEPEFAVSWLRVRLPEGSAAPGEHVSACYFEYDTVEPNAMTHSDPFSAYASQPYRMTLNGEEVSRQQLFATMNTVLRQQGKKLIETVDQGIENTVQGIENRIEAGLNTKRDQ